MPKSRNHIRIDVAHHNVTATANPTNTRKIIAAIDLDALNGVITNSPKTPTQTRKICPLRKGRGSHR